MSRKSLKPHRGFLSKSEVSFTGCGQDGVWWRKLSIVLSTAVGKILFNGSKQELPKWACVWIWFKQFLVWRVKFIIWKSCKMTACSARPGISDLSKEDGPSLQWCGNRNTKIADCWNKIAITGWDDKQKSFKVPEIDLALKKIIFFTSKIKSLHDWRTGLSSDSWFLVLWAPEKSHRMAWNSASQADQLFGFTIVYE